VQVRIVAGAVPGQGPAQVVLPAIFFAVSGRWQFRPVGLERLPLLQVTLGVVHGVPGVAAAGQRVSFPVFPVLQDLAGPGIEGTGGLFGAGGLLQVPGQGVQGGLVDLGSVLPLEPGQDGLAVLLERFPEACAGCEALGVVEMEPADLAVGAGAQLQDGYDAAEVVEDCVGLTGYIHNFSVKICHAEWEGAGVSCNEAASPLQVASTAYAGGVVRGWRRLAVAYGWPVRVMLLRVWRSVGGMAWRIARAVRDWRIQ